VLVQHLIAGISTDPWHLAMLEMVVEVAVGVEGVGGGGDGGGGVAPGPGEGEGDHGQRVLVLQVVEHGETDVLFLGQPHPVLQPLDRSLVLTSPLSLSFLLPLTPHPFHSPLPLILAPHTSGHPLISSHPGI